MSICKRKKSNFFNPRMPKKDKSLSAPGIRYRKTSSICWVHCICTLHCNITSHCNGTLHFMYFYSFKYYYSVMY